MSKLTKKHAEAFAVLASIAIARTAFEQIESAVIEDLPASFVKTNELFYKLMEAFDKEVDMVVTDYVDPESES